MRGLRPPAFNKNAERRRAARPPKAGTSNPKPCSCRKLKKGPRNVANVPFTTKDWNGVCLICLFAACRSEGNGTETGEPPAEVAPTPPQEAVAGEGDRI